MQTLLRTKHIAGMCKLCLAGADGLCRLGRKPCCLSVRMRSFPTGRWCRAIQNSSGSLSRFSDISVALHETCQVAKSDTNFVQPLESLKLQVCIRFVPPQRKYPTSCGIWGPYGCGYERYFWDVTPCSLVDM